MDVSVSTVGIPGCRPAVQSHYYGSKGHVSLHTVFPDGIDHGRREVDVEVTQKHYTVVVLKGELERKEIFQIFIFTVYSCELILIIYCRAMLPNLPL